VLNFMLWSLTAYLGLHIWGLHDEGETLTRALFSTGIQAGGVRFVFGKLLLGIVLFAVLLSFTRWLTRKLEFDWLVRAGVEASTRDAVATLFGYVTFVIAAVAGLSSAGLDLSKLAIVAGALSVGIGFGLQNIVSNFVSGLILLFERPVRSGDHVQVGITQGVVRKIRIRATEIETSDRETVIVPNSDLLSNHVRNRDLRNHWGKVVVAVTVAPDNDARRVQAVLLELLRQQRGVFTDRQTVGVTQPSVQLVGYSAAGLEFELQATLLDADSKALVASELRFAIYEAFRSEGIDLPSSRQEVYLRTAEGTQKPSAP